MGNCLKTQLKESVNNSNLLELNWLYFQLKALENPSQSTLQFTFNGVNKITTLNGAKFVLNYADINDNTKYLDTVSYNVPTNVTLYFVNISGICKVYNKYGIRGILTPEMDDIAHIVNFNIDDLKYSSIGTLRAESRTFSGDFNLLGKQTALTGNILQFDIFHSQIKGTIEGFVNEAMKVNRTNTSGINIKGLPYNATFMGHSIADIGGLTGTLIWENNNKIAVYGSSKVYTKGYTQAAAEAAFPGKTIVMVDA